MSQCADAYVEDEFEKKSIVFIERIEELETCLDTMIGICLKLCSRVEDARDVFPEILKAHEFITNSNKL